jgi:putative cell wall-binding protein
MKIEYIMHIAQDYRVLYNNAVSLAICEGWHFTHWLVEETGILGKNHQPV